MNTQPSIYALNGNRVISAVELFDYIQLRFSSGDLLNVFNEYEVRGATGLDVSSLKGMLVTNALASADSFSLVFGNLTLVVSLRDSAYRGPEAMEYVSAKGDRVVWS